MDLHLTRTGIKIPRLAFMVIASFLAALLTITMLPSGGYAADPAALRVEDAKADDAPDAKVKERPDRVSAMSTAQAQKSRVEDLSARTSTTSSYANADGSWTLDTYTAPIRTKDGNDNWVGLDPELESGKGGVRPKASALPMEFSNGGDKTFARVTSADGHKLKFGWPTKLKKPTLDGNVATYPDAVDGGDLVVTVNAEGFTHDVVLHEAPTGDKPLELRFPMGLDGAKASVTKGGAIEIKDGKELVASAPAPVMFENTDSDKIDKADREVIPIETSIEGTGGDTTLVMKPDMNFLTDPTTSYPLTIDPTFVVTPTADIWVQSTGDTTGQLTSPELRVGSNDGGTTKARSIVYFDLANLNSMPPFTVQSANLALSNFETGSCTGTNTEISRVTGGWNTSTLTWANQPAVTTAGAATSNGSYGATGCATESDVSFDVKTIFEAWVGGASKLGFRVAATNETAASGWRKFRANESHMATKIPRLTVTYNTAPATPTALAVTPSISDGSNQLTPVKRPTFTASVTDPDGGTLTPKLKLTQGSTVVEETTLPAVTSGSMASRKVASDLADGTYEARWQVSDGIATSAWTDPMSVVVDSTPPPAPTISCPSTTHLQWYDTKPVSSTTCTVTAGSGTEAITTTLNGSGVVFPALSGGTTSKSFALPEDGMFDLKVVARDKAGNPAEKSHTFGIGNGALTAPGSSARSSDSFVVNATSKSGATTAVLEWRLAGTSTWNAATHVKTGFVPWLGLPTSNGNMSTTGDLTWQASAETGVANPSTLDARVCFNYSGTPAQRCTAVNQVNLVPYAFGGSFPTSEIGPARVALMTGEYQISEDDVSVPSYDDTLNLTRTYQSNANAVSPAARVFGPGWVANLQGPEDGAAGVEVVDNTATNGTISLTAADGSTFTYRFASGGTVAQGVGVYEGQGEAATHNEKLEIKSGSPKTLELTAEDTVTTWNYAGSGTWIVNDIDDASTSPDETFSYSGGLVTGMYSGPTGVTCTATTQAKGCRALLLNYSTIGGQQRLTSVNLKTWDPKPTATGEPAATAAMESIVVQRYAYDSSGRLVEAWDPRQTVTTGQDLKTVYTYQTVDSSLHLASLTPPAEKAWNFNIGSAGRLETVTRQQDSAVGGSDATWTVDYSVPLSGSGLPNLQAGVVEGWGQTEAPDDATAVFGPDAPNTSDMTYASITYFTKEGRTTNNAAYGADAWQLTAANYDDWGNAIWSLTPGNRAAAAAAGSDGPAVGNLLATSSVYSPDGSRVESEIGPTRNLVLENYGSISGRSKTDYVYDDEAAAEGVPVPGRPATSSDPYLPKPSVVVEVRDMVVDGNGTTYDLHKTRYRYDKVVPTDGDGWELETPTRTSVSLGSGWSTTLTRFDSEGKVLETRTPQGVASVDGAGSDARSTVTKYFTADASSPVSACRNRPEWAGEECQEGRAAPTLTTPTTTMKGFDYLLNPTRVEETSSPMTRTTVTAFDQGGRPTKSSVVMSGATATEKPVDDTAVTYSSSNGAVTAISSGGLTSNTAYDSWGRVISKTDGAGNTATVTFDGADRVATSNDGKGTYSYTYNGTDALGREERRGVVTKLDVGLASGPDEFTVAYDANGDARRLRYPNGMTADSTRDAEGTEMSRTYANNGTKIAGFSRAVDVKQRTRANLTPLSFEWDNYDSRDRLTSVLEVVGGTPCVTRQYTLSLDSNRTAVATSGAASDGACSTSSPTTVNTNFYSDDRINDSAYGWDNFGRTQIVGAAHSDQPTGGPVYLDYFANDMVARISQRSDPADAATASEKLFKLDVLRRHGSMNSYDGGVMLRKTVNHYADDSDSPAWISSETRPNASTAWSSTWTRNVQDPLGRLGMIQASDGSSKIQITNLHGDVVSTTSNATSVSAMSNYAETNEFGVTRSGSTSLGQNYGWLGAYARSTDAKGGFTLMGMRVYNPAVGRFLSMDPIPGGNDNAYIYPADPINQSDVHGDLCWWRFSSCTKWFTKRGGAKVGVTRTTFRKKVWGKHRIRYDTMKYIIKRAIYAPYVPVGTPTRRAYDYNYREYECTNGKCKATGRNVIIRMIVDWGRSGDNKGFMVTMYCVRPGSQKCPSWVTNTPTM